MRIINCYKALIYLFLQVLQMLSTAVYFQTTSGHLVTQQQITCLKNSGKLDYALVYTHFQRYYQYYVPQIRLSYIVAAGIQPDLITDVTFLGQLSPDQQAQRFVNSWDVPIRMYWIDPGYASDSPLFTPSCDYLKGLAASLSKYSGKKVGFLTSDYAWNKIFTNQFSCPQLGNYPLFYHDYSKNFVQFGGWTKFEISIDSYEKSCALNDGTIWAIKTGK